MQPLTVGVKRRRFKEKEKEESLERAIWTLDFETDPFLFGRFVKPFACDIYNGTTHRTFWGKDCLKDLESFINTIDVPVCMYAHNGGRFDFMFLRHLFKGSLHFIGSRLVRGIVNKYVEMRDSYACLPVSLRQMDKDDIDYKKLEADVREDHKEEIIRYMQSDTRHLHKWITQWRDEFGDKLTMASAAMSKFQAFDYKVENMAQHCDAMVRPYYFGGRVECLQGTGEFHAPIKVYDIISSYPDAMRSVLHPISSSPIVSNRIGPKTFFVDVEGENRGAFITRTKTGYDYNRPSGRFKCTIHEFYAAVETGKFIPRKVHQTLNFLKWASFEEFIDVYFAKRKQADADKNEALKLFYKLVMNSCYGKFGQNPANYNEHQLVLDGEEFDNEGWTIALVDEVQGYTIFKRPALREDNLMRAGFLNVAVAASITGAGRAKLMRAIHGATSPYYCDTDSIFCKELSGVTIGKELGDFKLEAEGNYLALAGKKLYAFQKTDGQWKTARKGVRLGHQEIVRIARGETVTYNADAPTFSFFKANMQRVLSRNIRMTGGL